MKKLLIIIVSIFALLVTACSNLIPAYKIDIQQGNILTQDDVNQIHTGMSKRQVHFILGTPAIRDPFHQQRWDYVYTLKKGWGKTQEKQMTLYFENDALADIKGMEPDPTASKDPAQYHKTTVMVVHPEPKKNPNWLQKIWNSFFGPQEEEDI